MQSEQHLLVFLSLVLSLALAQVLTSAHRLLVARDRVDFHWIPLTWAAFICLMIAQVWWAFFGMIRDPVWANFFGFLLLVAATVLLYLAAALVLPDPPRSGTVDLWEEHLVQRHWFFGFLILGDVLIGVIDWLQDQPGLWQQNLVRGAAAILFLAMGLSSSKRLHGGATLLLCFLLVFFALRFTLRIG